MQWGWKSRQSANALARFITPALFEFDDFVDRHNAIKSHVYLKTRNNENYILEFRSRESVWIFEALKMKTWTHKVLHFDQMKEPRITTKKFVLELLKLLNMSSARSSTKHYTTIRVEVNDTT